LPRFHRKSIFGKIFQPLQKFKKTAIASESIKPGLMIWIKSFEGQQTSEQTAQFEGSLHAATETCPESWPGQGYFSLCPSDFDDTPERFEDYMPA